MALTSPTRLTRLPAELRQKILFQVLSQPKILAELRTHWIEIADHATGYAILEARITNRLAEPIEKSDALLAEDMKIVRTWWHELFKEWRDVLEAFAWEQRLAGFEDWVVGKIDSMLEDPGFKMQLAAWGYAP